MTRPMTQRIASLIEKGASNKAIVAKLKCRPQQVYNTRHYMKKKEEAARMVGRKKIRIVKLATENNYKPSPAMLAPLTPESFSALTDARIVMHYEEQSVWQSVWQRIKAWLS